MNKDIQNKLIIEISELESKRDKLKKFTDSFTTNHSRYNEVLKSELQVMNEMISISKERLKILQSENVRIV